MPMAKAICAVIGSVLVSPRMPSVPKNLRVIARALARLADPAPEARRHPADRAVQPGRDEEQQGSTDQRDRTRIAYSASERKDRRLRRPVMPVFTELAVFLAVLSGGATEREDDDRTVEHQRLRHGENHHVDCRPNGEAPHHGMAC